MVKNACKCKEEECEACPEWIFTFADLVMLLMGFFVILWVLKPAEKPAGGTPTAAQAQAEEDWKEKVGEFRKAWGWVPDPHSNDPIDQAAIRRMNVPGDKGRARQQSRGALGTDDEVQSIRLGRQATVGGKLLFDTGSTALGAGSRGVLDQIAEKIRGHRNIILVKGHTSMDDYGEAATAQQKMDISIRRAQTVADYLTTKGVDPDTLRVVGCSIFEPIFQGEYVPNIQNNNRRVEVDVTTTSVEEFQDRRRRAAAPVEPESTMPRPPVHTRP